MQVQQTYLALGKVCWWGRWGSSFSPIFPIFTITNEGFRARKCDRPSTRFTGIQNFLPSISHFPQNSPTVLAPPSLLSSPDSAVLAGDRALETVLYSRSSCVKLYGKQANADELGLIVREYDRIWIRFESEEVRSPVNRIRERKLGYAIAQMAPACG